MNSVTLRGFIRFIDLKLNNHCISVQVYRQASRLFNPLLDMLTEHSDLQYDKVVKMALLVVATLSSSKGSSPTGNPGSADTRQAPAAPHEPKQKEQATSSPPVAGRGGKQPGKQQQPLAQPQLNKYFHMFMVELLKLFDCNRTLLEAKGSFIIR